jgi:hypothetical protein
MEMWVCEQVSRMRILVQPKAHDNMRSDAHAYVVWLCGALDCSTSMSSSSLWRTLTLLTNARTGPLHNRTTNHALETPGMRDLGTQLSRWRQQRSFPPPANSGCSACWAHSRSCTSL